ncbi:MAG TPA: DUF4331 family protein [Gemmatimonadales bacterium]|jgi:hypothetical protein|nr:DUF4331 family protein [Gemmatimonadales bacterium]
MTRIAKLAGLAVVGALLGCQSPYAPRDIAMSVLMNKDLQQEDRFGLPAIATVFIPTALKDAYNTGSPSGDVATYKSLIVSKLMAFGQDAASAEALASALAPDIQPVDLAQPSAFLNGRKPADDVITGELHLIFGSNAALNDDHVDANDTPFLTTFPYLAGPHVQ